MRSDDAAAEQPPTIDESNFDEFFDASVQRIGKSLGYAVFEPSGQRLTDERRLTRVRAQGSAALDYLTRLQLSQSDDSREVAEAATTGVRKVLHQAFVGDQGEKAWRATRRPYIQDRIVRRLLGPVDPDQREPWWTLSKYQRWVRRAILTAVLLAAAGASVSLATGNVILAFPLIICTGVLDILDGAFARAVGMRRADLRWQSCIASQAADLLLIGGVALEALNEGSTPVAIGVLAAMTCALFGSFTRVSALQAGFRFWRSWSERFIRSCAVLLYALLAVFGYGVIGAILVAVAVGAFGLYEAVRVFVSVGRTHTRSGGLVLVDEDNHLTFVALSDDPTTVRPEKSRRSAHAKHAATQPH